LLRREALILGATLLTLLCRISPVSSATTSAAPITSLPREDITGMEYLPVPAACFLMGNGFSDAYHIEKPVHEVCLNGFSMARFDVRVADFRKFVGDTGYRTDAEAKDGCYVHDGLSWTKEPAASWRSPGFPQGENHPVVCVSWNDAVAYARWLSRKSGQEYRLPTEAEWEYAARSGGRIERYAGGNDPETVAWFADNSGNQAHPVGLKRANGLGLYDMSGNVWQWTADWYGETYYRESPQNDPQGPSSGTKRVFRGGSWFYDVRGVRASYRDFAVPDYRSSYLGFRLVLQTATRVNK